ncbi:MAG: hypothetical protein QNK18_11610 [Gammaproteobacteria bacterium]|nr:hypothetical protein [Gammaproteobacteria bacterium]
MGKLITASVIAFLFTTAQADQTSPLDLEPCINGGVSASGTYPTQAAEDLASSYQRGSELVDLAYEPCVNGGVSSSGRYTSQALEDVMERGRASSE